MRILMLTDLYWPLVGGLEQVVRALSHELTARGHTVAVCTLGQGKLATREDDEGVTVLRLTGALQRSARLFSDSHRRYAAPLPDPESVLGLRRVMGEFRPDVVHGHNWLVRSFLPLKPTSGVPLVVTLHDYGRWCAKRSLYYLEEGPCRGPGVRKCLRCAGTHYGGAKGAGVAATNWVGQAIEDRLVDMYLPISQSTAAGNGLPAAHAPHQVIPNFHRVTSERSPAAETYAEQLPEGEFVLFVGALSRHKGLDVLLEAHGRLRRPVPLVLIGSRWPGMPRVPDGVTVLHDWPHEAVRLAWERCTLGVVPSVWREPFGLVALEAMAAARPVVASDIGGLSEIVAPGETGLLVAPGDAVQLTDAIARLLDDPALRARMGRAARERVELFSPERIVPRIVDVYTTVSRRTSRTADALSQS
jgi:glycosyltransferase involved in cell wall biosynthesis